MQISNIYFCFSCYYLQIRERLYGLVSPATDGIVTADQVIETIASTKCVRSAASLQQPCGEKVDFLNIGFDTFGKIS